MALPVSARLSLNDKAGCVVRRAHQATSMLRVRANKLDVRGFEPVGNRHDPSELPVSAAGGNALSGYFFPWPTKKPTRPDAMALTMPAAHFLSSGVPAANT